MKRPVASPSQRAPCNPCVPATLPTVDEGDLRDALAGFTPIWDQLFPREQERILRLLIERVTYDPDGGDLDIDLRPCGIETLADEAREAS